MTEVDQLAQKYADPLNLKNLERHEADMRAFKVGFQAARSLMVEFVLSLGVTPVADDLNRAAVIARMKET